MSHVLLRAQVVLELKSGFNTQLWRKGFQCIEMFSVQLRDTSPNICIQLPPGITE